MTSALASVISKHVTFRYIAIFSASTPLSALHSPERWSSSVWIPATTYWLKLQPAVGCLNSNLEELWRPYKKIRIILAGGGQNLIMISCCVFVRVTIFVEWRSSRNNRFAGLLHLHPKSVRARSSRQIEEAELLRPALVRGRTEGVAPRPLRREERRLRFRCWLWRCSVTCRTWSKWEGSYLIYGGGAFIQCNSNYFGCFIGFSSAQWDKLVRGRTEGVAPRYVWGSLSVTRWAISQHCFRKFSFLKMLMYRLTFVIRARSLRGNPQCNVTHSKDFTTYYGKWTWLMSKLCQVIWDSAESVFQCRITKWTQNTE